MPASLEYPKITCNQLLEQAASRFPDRACTLYKDRTLSYSQVDRISTNLASGLRRIGLQKGQRVGLLLPNIPQYVISYYAILKAGGVLVAMNPQATGAEIALEASETGMTLAITHKNLYPAIKKIQVQTTIQSVIVTTMDECLQPADYYLAPDSNLKSQTSFDDVPDPDHRLTDLLSSEPGELPIVSPDDPAIFQYTGGTTGTPKAAVGLHRNLTANTLQFRKWLWNFEDGKETLLTAIPMFHVYGMVLCLNLSMIMGATLLLVTPGRDLNGLLGEITHHKPTLFPGVPSLYRAMVNHPGLLKGDYSLESLKVCVSGSAPLPPDVKRKFDQLFHGRLVEGYGLSEAPTATHCNPVHGQNITGSIGLPLPDVDCLILSLEDGVTELGPGETGELVISGPQVMQGYHQNQAETQLVLQNGWLFTGDIARMDANGYFYILDRKKDLIKVNGLQVWPHEIEEVIALHPAVRDVGVIGVPDEVSGETVKAWIVLKDDAELSLEDVTEWCSRSLSRYKIPTQIQILPELPRSTIGKLMRRELKLLHTTT